MSVDTAKEPQGDVVSSGPGGLEVQPAPHLTDPITTTRLMLDVIIALIPAFLASLVFFQWNSLRVLALCLIGCLATEYLFNRVRNKPNSLSDLSAVVTAIILAFSLPPTLPWFAVLMGAIVAIALGKMFFGGLGQNIFNPAMVGRAFLMVTFASLMTTWVAPAAEPGPPVPTDRVEAVTAATPLAQIKPGDPERPLPETWRLFVGRTAGSLGETSVIALLIGAAYLLIRRTIDWTIPFGMLGAALAFAAIAYLAAPGKFANPMFHLGAGSLVFGAFFIATDLVTSPLSKSGRVVFGAGCGVLTMVIRQFGTYPEGVMFSILMMNALAPLIGRWMRPTPLGGKARG